MTQEYKDLLLKYLCMALPYGIKIMVEGWDSDSGCEYTTIETLIGIDDRFIHTIWDKTGDKDKHYIIEPKSILDYKPYLRPMSSMTEEERNEYNEYLFYGSSIGLSSNTATAYELIDWLNKKMFDYLGLIPKGLAIEVTKENNPYKD